MPTALDRAMHSKNLFLGFAGMVTAAAAWVIWGSDIFPAESDPTGGKHQISLMKLQRLTL
ncbi:hypothetical protein BDV34DRAFT_227644 [Aspergillus parasiticus]|uniref:Uncharacterized protein n=2 Tax=Aspergillus subgen. Circumdati TaxID=2720871 RepID=A0A5N6DDE2_ASPPA|nr:hypothetical protein BDV34DRAFT_227644 [Aspergillus parasiticus]